MCIKINTAVEEGTKTDNMTRFQYFNRIFSDTGGGKKKKEFVPRRDFHRHRSAVSEHLDNRLITVEFRDDP